MRGEQAIHQNLMVDVPPWSSFSDDHFPVSGIGGAAAGDYLLNEAVMAALQRYLPANGAAETEASDLSDPPIDAFSCDEFRMYEFKIRRCVRGRSHDWTECPYAHPGEKALRRDPKTYHYSGTACPDFRKGNCKRGDACEFSHGVFECWLHPARYRTQPCKDGTSCRRRVCFFAHTPEQLRVLPSPQQHSRMTLESYDGSPMRLHAVDAFYGKGVISASPTSTLLSPPLSPRADSPPISPACRGSWTLGSPMNDVVASLRTLQLSKVSSVPCSPWGGMVMGPRQGFCSLPSTPVKTMFSDGCGSGEWLGSGSLAESSEPVERVESGRALREKMYERLSRRSGLGRAEVGPLPDVGWVSELVK
ncbi:Zinc finger CCCH domain-containing protein 20 [Platanthera guangdongensis]|uniref:Zinc finger CCCH domain-containing protein 20 n=1 Tax=Platanthera guangdongensis TaxID=2320717 RepID=A0ABR2LFC0_9ASPA